MILRTQIPIFSAVLTAGLALALASPAEAQNNRYNQWTNPDGTSQQKAKEAQAFADELNKLVKEAERARAADPQFLRDLRDLARKYDNPWRVSQLNETFSDGDFTQNPVWTVSKGKFWIERGFGLRASFDQTQSSPDTSSSKSDPAAQILGAILNQALGGGGGSAGDANPITGKLPQAAIHTATPISNAFVLRLEMTSWKDRGFFEVGPYQGENRSAGYRLLYRTGKTPSVELVRISSRGTGLIDSYNQALKLEDKKTHLLEWTRDQFGEMKVSVDSKEIIKTNDRSFRAPFDGLTLINNGGDYIISRVSVHGAQ